MFDFDEYKSFKDMVHGYIQIPMLFVQEIIDTPLFQRLRFIEQTGMRQVYPSARHDRFVHSLGTFYLGTKAVDALLKNFKGSDYWNIYSDDQREIFWAKNKVLFLIACLLHDIGHAPFSHSLEHLYIHGENDKEREIDKLLQKYFSVDEMYKEFYNEKTKELKPHQPHEIVSAILVMDKYKENILRILNRLNKKKYPNENNTLVSEHAVIPKIIDSSDIENDLYFIARMITGITYKDFEPEKQIRNCFISLLNGTTFDVDKLDYITRDSKMSGLDNVQLDIDRLLNSLYIIPITKFVNYYFEKDNSNSKFDNIILGITTTKNNKSNLEGLYFHGNLSVVQGKISIGENSKIESMTGKLETGENNGQAEFTENSYIWKNGVEVKKDKLFPNLKKLPNKKKLDVVLENTETVNKFEFNCKNNDNNEPIIEINNFIGKINIFDGNFLVSSAVQLKGNLYGKFAKVKVLGDWLKEHEFIPKSEVFNSFQIGFKNSALSVIQNISIARNYLYLWVYSHHKVVYYANYLIPELLILTAQVMKKNTYDFISYTSIPDMDDASVISLFKDAYKEALSDKDKYKKFINLYSEYTSRKYKRSLFKSLAEYDLFFIDFTPNEKMQLKFILNNGVEKIRKSYGDIETDFNIEYGIESLIWIDANLSIKEIEPGKIFIRFDENELNTMEQINILSVKNNIKRDNPYFYVYYSFIEKDMEVQSVSGKTEEFKKKLSEWFRNKLS